VSGFLCTSDELFGEKRCRAIFYNLLSDFQTVKILLRLFCQSTEHFELGMFGGTAPFK
jgi:hypothetical protein